jgi:hypothetical protein
MVDPTASPIPAIRTGFVVGLVIGLVIGSDRR